MSLDLYLIDECPHCGREDTITFNITHNLGRMATAAGIYRCLWCAEESGYATAQDIIPTLTEGVKKMDNDPERFEKFDAPNGWGTYDDFLPWLKKVLKACIDNPTYKLKAHR